MGEIKTFYLGVLTEGWTIEYCQKRIIMEKTEQYWEYREEYRFVGMWDCDGLEIKEIK